MTQIHKVSRVNGTVVQFQDGTNVATNDDFFKENQLVFLLRENSVLSDKLRGSLRLRHDSYAKMPSGLCRLLKDVAVRTALLVPLHIKDKATGQFHVPTEGSSFDFLSLLGVEPPEVALAKYTFEAGVVENETVSELYPDTVNPDRSYVSDEDLFNPKTEVIQTVLGMTPATVEEIVPEVIDSAEDFYELNSRPSSGWSAENEEAANK